MGDAKGQRKKKNRVITRDIGVPLLDKGSKILVADFDVDEIKLKPEHKSSLDDLVFGLIINPNRSIIGLEGRASETGPSKNNLYLSIERATAVQKYLRTNKLRRIIVKDSQIVPLGDKYPLENATGPGPEDKEIAANRSVMIYMKHPPIAVGFALDAKGSYVAAVLYKEGQSTFDLGRITLDGRESRPCPGFRIVSYLWEQYDYKKSESVELRREKTLKEHLTSMEERSDWTVSFLIPQELLDGKIQTLKFKLTVTDENQLTSFDIVLITIERLLPQEYDTGPVLTQWGLKMLGSVSLTAFAQGVVRYLGGAGGVTKRLGLGINPRYSLGVGGLVGLGLLNKKNIWPPHVILFVGLGGGFTAGVKISKSRGLFSGLKLKTSSNVFKMEAIEILRSLGFDIDAPWEDYKKFTCTYTDYHQFNFKPAAIGAAGVALFFVGKSEGVINFLTIDTDPAFIDIGGVNFVKPESLVGLEVKVNAGGVMVFSAPGFVEFLDSIGWKT